MRLALLCLFFLVSTAGSAWPTRPVRVIATSPPGGSVDLLARIAAEEFSKAFAQPFAGR